METLQEKLRTAKLDKMNIRDAIDNMKALRDEVAYTLGEDKPTEKLHDIHQTTRHSIQLLENYCTKMTDERREQIKREYPKE